MQHLIVDQRIVAGRRAILEHRAAGVGGDHGLVDALDLRRQTEALGAGVGLAGLEAARVIGKAAQVDAGIVGLADAAQNDVVGPGAFGGRQAVVADGPGDVDDITLVGVRRGGDLGDLQVRAGGQFDLHRTGHARVVVAEDKFERTRGVDADVIGTGEAVRQADIRHTVIAATHGKHAQMGDAVEHANNTGARRIAGQIDGVVPCRGIGRADAQVADCPAHLYGLARHRGRRHGGIGNLKIRVGDGHHVEEAHSLTGVVGFQVVFVHLAQGVGAREEVIAALEVRWQQQGLVARVGLIRVQRAIVAVDGQNLVIAIAGDGVGGGHQRVAPAAGHASALVGDGPGDRDLGRVADHRIGHHHAGRRFIRHAGDSLYIACHQVGIGRQCDRGAGVGAVVAFGGVAGGVFQLVCVRIRGHSDQQVANAGVAFRQRQAVYAGKAAAGRHGTFDRRVVIDVGIEHRCAGRGVGHHDAVVPEGCGRQIAGVDVGPTDRHHVACQQVVRGERQVLHLQIGIGRERRIDRDTGDVVVLSGTRVDAIAVVFVLPAINIGCNGNLHVADARVAIRQRKVVSARHAVAAGQGALRAVVVVHGGIEQGRTGAGVQHHDAVMPVRACRQVTGVGIFPGDVHDTTGLQATGWRHRQVLHLQVGIGSNAGGNHHVGAVVAVASAIHVVFVLVTVGIGGHADLQVAHAGIPVGQRQAVRTRQARARINAAFGRLVVIDVGVEQRRTGGGIHHHDVVVPGRRGRQGAGVDVIPADRHHAAGLQPAGRGH